MKKTFLSLFFGFFLSSYSFAWSSDIDSSEEKFSNDPKDHVKVYPLKAGPRINVFKDTDGNQVLRIWGHAGDQEEGVKKVIGVLLLGDGKKPEAPLKKYFFPLKEENRWCGMVDVFGLQPSHSYHYLVGYTEFSSRKDLKNKFLDFDKCNQHRNGGTDDPILMPSNDHSQKFSFFVGSCRFPLCRTQLPFDVLSKILDSYFPFKNPLKNANLDDLIPNEEKDATYRALFHRGDGLQKKGKNPSALFLVGDQIYADRENVFLSATSSEEFKATYQEAFGSPDVVKVIARYPTKTVLDDHELQNDFSQKTMGENPEKAKIAFTSYLQFQAMGTPLYNPYLNDSTTYVMNQKLWYEDDICGEPVFCMDNRTERVPGEKMISKDQMTGFFKFLKNSPIDRMKIIVASVPFFPDYPEGDEGRADKWSGFESQRNKILRFIEDNKIQKVVFLSGDVHSSVSAQLNCSKDENFLVTSIISSPLYWPYHYIGVSGAFEFEKPVATVDGRSYNIEKHSDVIYKNNFTLIQVNDQRDAVKVQVVISDPKHPQGKVVSSTRYDLLRKSQSSS